MHSVNQSINQSTSGSMTVKNHSNQSINGVFSRALRSQHVSQRMILLVKGEYRGVGDFGVLLHSNSERKCHAFRKWDEINFREDSIKPQTQKWWETFRLKIGFYFFSPGYSRCDSNAGGAFMLESYNENGTTKTVNRVSIKIPQKSFKNTIRGKNVFTLRRLCLGMLIPAEGAQLERNENGTERNIGMNLDWTRWNVSFNKVIHRFNQFIDCSGRFIPRSIPVGMER